MPDLLDSIRGLPCGAALLDAAVPGTYLVGGAVRDLLRGETPRELDVAVVGDPAPLMGALGGEPRQHERFGTASVAIGDCRIDVGIARAERYPRPGALPEVRPAPMEDDLARRDFTVNAIAVELVDGTVRAAPHALEDLEHGVLRVLHDGSFRDDPTRLWRLARYRARLGFAIEEHTLELARQAVRENALDTISGTRIGNELRLALAEPDPVGALEQAVALGLAPWLQPDRDRIERALEILPEEGDRALTVLATAATEGLPDLGFTAGAVKAVDAARALRATRLHDASPSLAATAFDGRPVEAIAALGTPEAERWLRTDRHRRLAITGEDLLEAGVPEGPELGRRLSAARAALLDGRVGDDPQEQLALALGVPEAAREPGRDRRS